MEKGLYICDQVKNHEIKGYPTLPMSPFNNKGPYNRGIQDSPPETEM